MKIREFVADNDQSFLILTYDRIKNFSYWKKVQENKI